MTEKSDNTSDGFQVAITILIAFVSILGAVIAWRASVADVRAEDADFDGLSAVLNAEKTRVFTSIDVYEDNRAYLDYIRSTIMSNLLAADMVEAGQGERAAMEAELEDYGSLNIIHNYGFFSVRYLNLDNTFNLERQYLESQAEAGIDLDLESGRHFTEADAFRSQSTCLVGSFIILAFALFFYSIAGGLHPTRRQLRWGMALLGTLLLVGGGLAALFIEIWR